MSVISFNTADETTVSLFRNWYTCFARIRHESAASLARLMSLLAHFASTSKMGASSWTFRRELRRLVWLGNPVGALLMISFSGPECARRPAAFGSACLDRLGYQDASQFHP